MCTNPTQSAAAISTIGIDIDKATFHLVGGRQGQLPFVEVKRTLCCHISRGRTPRIYEFTA
jgi:hypothetical protein